MEPAHAGCKEEKIRKRNRNRSSDGFHVACMEYLRYLAFFFVCVDISSYCSHLLVSFVHTYGTDETGNSDTAPVLINVTLHIRFDLMLFRFNLYTSDAHSKQSRKFFDSNN